MKFSPPLQHATLVQRYKRFLADVITPEGEQLTLHCPNTGAMTGCATPGDRVWYSTSENTKRKYAHTWEMTETQNGSFICVNTLRVKFPVQQRRFCVSWNITVFTGMTRFCGSRHVTRRIGNVWPGFALRGFPITAPAPARVSRAQAASMTATAAR